MTTIVTPVKAEQPKDAAAENQKGIEYHKQAAMHHEEAAKHHLDAAKQHEAGNHDKACESTVKANGHSCLATEHQQADLKAHALKK
jgi:hypothetical protein